jgi:hypothetical protein
MQASASALRRVPPGLDASRNALGRGLRQGAAAVGGGAASGWAHIDRAADLAAGKVRAAAVVSGCLVAGAAKDGAAWMQHQKPVRAAGTCRCPVWHLS